MESNKDPHNQEITADSPPQKNVAPKICIEGCTFDGKANARFTSYVNCLICYDKFHCTCVGLTDQFVGSWSCAHCRTLPAEVNHMKSQIASLLTQNATLLEMVTQQQNTLNSIQMIATKVTALHSKIIPDADDESDEDDEIEVEPSGTLLIGDSLLRDVVATDDSLSVDSTGGANISAIRKKLRAINPKRKKYESVIVVVGTNDASTKRPPEKICSDFQALISTAKLIARTVVLSSIPPRDDNKVDRGKLDTIHQLLIPIVNKEDVRFVDNDPNFLYRDNSVDTSLLLADKLHLSAAGVSKLLANIGLSEKAKTRLGNQPSTTWKRPTPEKASAPQTIPPLMQVPTTPMTIPPPAKEPVLFRGAKSPLSNFFPCALSIWNVNFKSSEHAFQYSKCIQMNNKPAAANVLNAETALQAKRIGDSISPNPRWHDTKQGTMYEILKSKSRQCPHFNTALINSNNRSLVEDTDNPIWGRGPDGNGLNLLGRLLMTVRAELSASKYTPHPSVRPPRNHQGRTAPHSYSQQPRCFNCGEPSHTADTCGLSRPIQCYGCGGEGHKKKFCRSARNISY